MLKFKYLRTSFSVIISATVTVMQYTLSLIALFIDIKVTESSLLTVIINLFKLFLKLHVMFLTAVKSQSHLVLLEVNIFIKMIIKTASLAETKFLIMIWLTKCNFFFIISFIYHIFNSSMSSQVKKDLNIVKLTVIKILITL